MPGLNSSGGDPVSTMGTVTPLAVRPKRTVWPLSGHVVVDRALDAEHLGAEAGLAGDGLVGGLEVDGGVGQALDGEEDQGGEDDHAGDDLAAA